MSKKMVAVLVACVSVFALCIALVGCGGDNKKDFVSKWELTEIQSTDASAATSKEDVAMLKAAGLTVTLSLNEDGSAVLNMFGEESNGSWKASSAKKGSMEITGMGGVDIELKDGNLVMADSTTTLIFQKVTS